jgi:3-isopropylmalate/(R)-2-methylmalate dehydratase small subunit
MKTVQGKILFLDRSDINTDEIIPAIYLTEITKEALKPHVLEDLKLPGFDPKKDVAGKGVVVARSNFGCGSSREHAPWALEINGIRVVIARSFARIFRQNMFNGGLLAVELPEADIQKIFDLGDGGASADISLDAGTVTVKSGRGSAVFRFSLSPFDAALVRAGGWVDYADKRY